MATTFAAGQTINLSLDGNDTITWVGSGNMTVTPASGPSWAVHLEGSQTYGPFGQAVSVSIVTVTNGNYTVNGGSFPVVANESPLTGGIDISVNGWNAMIGPSGDVTGVSDRLNLQNAYDALPVFGGEITLSRGVFYLDSEVVFAKPIRLTGAGGGLAGDAGTADPLAPTTIKVISGTSNGIKITSSGCTLRDFALINTSVTTPTSGAGVLNTSCNTATIDAITVLGFWNNLDLGGVYYSVTNCKIYDAVNYYIYVHSPSAPYNDHGDMVIANNVISAWKYDRTAAAQIRWESGGGLKIVGNKFNGGVQPGNSNTGRANYCIDIRVADGVTTGSFVITGNSISSNVATTSNMYIGLLGPSKTGRIVNLLIVGNEIPVGNQGITIEGDSAHDDAIRNINIAENMFSALTTSSIKLRYVRQCRIGANMHASSVAGLLVDIPDLTSNIVGLRVERQHIGEITSKDIIRDGRSIGNTAINLQGGVDYDYTHGLGISTNGVWTQVFKIEVPNQSAGSFDIEVDGRSTDTTNTSPNRKGIILRQSRTYAVDNVGTSTFSTIGTDVAAGAASAFAAIRYVSTANWIAVEVQTTDVTNCVLWGSARLRVNGKLQTFHIGT